MPDLSNLSDDELAVALEKALALNEPALIWQIVDEIHEREGMTEL